MPADDQPAPALRRDAARNRQAVLDAARALAATDGLDLRHADVARAAGVGMGTVYRRFPTREDLLEALFGEHIAAVVQCATEALSAPTGWSGIEQFMTRQLELQADDRGLRELLRQANMYPALAESARVQIAAVAQELVARAQREGDLDYGVTEGDLITIHLMVTGLMDAAEAEAPQLWKRALAIALSGLRHATLPGAPLKAEAADRMQGHLR